MYHARKNVPVEVTIKVFDINGEAIDNLLSNEILGSGRKEIVYNGAHLIKGVYAFHIVIDGKEYLRKVVKM